MRYYGSHQRYYDIQLLFVSTILDFEQKNSFFILISQQVILLERSYRIQKEMRKRAHGLPKKHLPQKYSTT